MVDIQRRKILSWKIRLVKKLIFKGLIEDVCILDNKFIISDSKNNQILQEHEDQFKPIIIRKLGSCNYRKVLRKAGQKCMLYSINKQKIFIFNPRNSKSNELASTDAEIIDFCYLSNHSVVIYVEYCNRANQYQLIRSEEQTLFVNTKFFSKISSTSFEIAKASQVSSIALSPDKKRLLVNDKNYVFVYKTSALYNSDCNPLLCSIANYSGEFSRFMFWTHFTDTWVILKVLYTDSEFGWLDEEKTKQLRKVELYDLKGKELNLIGDMELENNILFPQLPYKIDDAMYLIDEKDKLLKFTISNL